MPVEFRELDGYLYANPLPRLRAIKIHLEGFEKEVLIGATRTLNETEGLALFMDIHPGHGVRREEIYKILQSHGYALLQENFPFNLPLERSAKARAYRLPFRIARQYGWWPNDRKVETFMPLLLDQHGRSSRSRL